MNACATNPGRALLLAVTVPPEWAWAVAVRNTVVLNVPVAPSDAALGGYVAVCAGAEHEPALAPWLATWCAVEVPPTAELRACAVVAVGQLEVVSQYPDCPQSPWYAGPVGLWLGDVVPLPEAVPCEPDSVSTYWTLPEDVRSAVRAAYSAVKQADAARRKLYEERAAAALNAPTLPGLRERVLKLCTCRRAMTPCPVCRALRCPNPACPPHTCAQEGRQP
ncbi:hypothetical protein JY651_07830 [Pyxidicoccus parkwayensis]|uniref:Uncharacterized protein n=1 Tax=Pyxidicoccus parkwayensis TaxID=2813578 RepID=A0ABX7P316_9BACT|nr:hypothetical protein [Pyxidicoccus parkwaysis]QSQ24839.1 hypothetical protein JY651_07830 [Pyxidicoccus parkwaysis]